MGQTSLPLGKRDSNCVIAAHRGYQGIPYFRDIEELKIGDLGDHPKSMGEIKLQSDKDQSDRSI